MADIKDSALSPVTSVLSTDILAVTVDPGGTPATRKITTADFFTGRTLAAVAAFGIRSSGAAFDLQMRNTEVLTANRMLTISLNNAARSLTVAGDATISGSNSGDQSAASLGLVIGTNVQAWNANLDTWATKTPPAGTLLITTAKTFTVSDNITLASDGTGTRTLNVGAGGTLGSNAFNSTAFLTANQTITLSGDISGSGATSLTTTIGATKVTSAMLNSDVFSTAHSWGGQQTFVAPILGTPASGVATNLTGLPPTTGIVGWPANASGVLTNNGSGTLSWASAGGGGITIGTTTITSGTGGRLLFDSAGVVGEDADLSFATDTLTATKVVAPTSLSTPSIITASGALSIAPASNASILLNTTERIQIGGTSDHFQALRASTDSSFNFPMALEYADDSALGNLKLNELYFQTGSFNSASATIRIVANTGLVQINATGVLQFTSASTITTTSPTIQTGISQISSGLVGIGTGAQGSFAGNLKLTDLISNGVVRLKGYTVATLPGGTQGDTAFVTDALAPTFLATIVGGGAVVTPVFFNGTSWVGY